MSHMKNGKRDRSRSYDSVSPPRKRSRSKWSDYSCRCSPSYYSEYSDDYTDYSREDSVDCYPRCDIPCHCCPGNMSPEWRKKETNERNSIDQKKKEEGEKRGRSMSRSDRSESRTLSNRPYSGRVRSPVPRTPSPENIGRRYPAEYRYSSPEPRWEDIDRGDRRRWQHRRDAYGRDGYRDAATDKLADLFDGEETWRRNERPRIKYLEPLQVIRVSFEQRYTGATYNKVYHAWAFAPEYLFTSRLALECERGYEITDIRITNPMHTTHETNVRLKVHYISREADVAILSSADGHVFDHLKMHEPYVETVETIYHVDMIDREWAAMYKGKFLPDVNFGPGSMFAGSDARFAHGHCMGSPVVLSDGSVVGMNVRPSWGDEIITIHGLAMVMEEANGRVAIDYNSWGMDSNDPVSSKGKYTTIEEVVKGKQVNTENEKANIKVRFRIRIGGDGQVTAASIDRDTRKE